MPKRPAPENPAPSDEPEPEVEPAKKAGRPSKRTPEVEERILGALKAGNYLETAAAYAGVHYDTLNEWRKRYPDFAEAVEIARASAEVRNVAIILTAAPKNWQAAAWWLERSFPQKFGRRIEHSGEVTIHEQSDFDREIAALMDDMARRAEVPALCPSQNGSVAKASANGATSS